MIPAWLRARLTPSDVTRIEATIREVEARTSGEVVPMIVRRSTPTMHAPVIIGLALVAAYFAFGMQARLAALHGPSSWWLVLHVAVIVALAWGLGRLSPLQRWLTSAHEQERLAAMRAEAEFYQARLHQTRGATGILLFVSLMERRAVVLADVSIAARLPADAWRDVARRLVEGAKGGRLADGFCDALRACGDLVAPHFPREARDVNELFDRLIVKD